MRKSAWIVLLALLLIPMVPGPGDAKPWDGHGHHGHGHKGRGHGGHHDHGHYGKRWYGGYYGPKFSFGIGPWWYPAYAHPYPYYRHHYPCDHGHPYPYPRHHETRVIVEEAPVYVERPQGAAPAAPAAPPQAYWHWCESRRGYYPEVSRCPEGWVKVPPRPE